jgi:hypothetical protein
LVLAPLADEVVPGTPMTALSRSARRLDTRRPLAEQVEAAISGYVPGQYTEAVDATFAAPPLARPLREVLYELLGLPEPGEPASLAAWPPPVPDSVPVASYVMHTRVCDDRVEVARFPAGVRRHVAEPAAGWTGHLSAGDEEWDLRTLQSSEVMTRAVSAAPPEAWEWARVTLHDFPGCAIACASTADGCVAAFRDGRRAIATIAGGGLDVVAIAACLYALARDHRLTEGERPVRTARGTARVVVRLLPGL